jgi:hypothetical protein
MIPVWPGSPGDLTQTRSTQERSTQGAGRDGRLLAGPANMRGDAALHASIADRAGEGAPSAAGTVACTLGAIRPPANVPILTGCPRRRGPSSPPGWYCCGRCGSLARQQASLHHGEGREPQRLGRRAPLTQVTRSRPGRARRLGQKGETQIHTDKQGCTQIPAEPTLAQIQPSGRASAPSVCIPAYPCASAFPLPFA